MNRLGFALVLLAAVAPARAARHPADPRHRHRRDAAAIQPGLADRRRARLHDDRRRRGQGDYLLFTFQPEFDLRAADIPEVGLGIDAPLRFQLGGDSTATLRFRSEDYDDRNEILSILRYVRYGEKGADRALYARFGAIDFGRIGYGARVEAYRNEVGQDARARGGAFDLDLGGLGVETLYGSFTRPGVYAGRGFVRPFRLIGGEPGGLNDLTVGVTVAGNLNQRGGYVNAAAPGQPFFLDTALDGTPTAEGVLGVDDRGTLHALGLDVGLRLTQPGLLGVGVYGNATRFSDTSADGGAGMGGGIGVLLSVAPPEATGTRFDARLEAVYGCSGYLPSVFNAFYEVERLYVADSVDVAGPLGPVRRARYQSRRNALAAAPSQGGLVAQASAVFLGVFRVEGRYQQLFETGATGRFHVGADLLLPNNVATLRAGIDRWNIGGDQTTNTDAEGRNLSMQAELGVHLSPYLLVGGRAQRAFAPVYTEAASWTSSGRTASSPSSRPSSRSDTKGRDGSPGPRPARPFQTARFGRSQSG